MIALLCGRQGNVLSKVVEFEVLNSFFGMVKTGRLQHSIGRHLIFSLSGTRRLETLLFRASGNFLRDFFPHHDGRNVLREKLRKESEWNFQILHHILIV